jgi:hypothetical protein
MNLHLTERWIRLGIGAVLIALFLWGPKTPWGLLGLIFIASGITGFCPIWKVLGISTLRKPPPVRRVSSDNDQEQKHHEDNV